MNQPYSNIILIGMPGSGKSTVGVILAKKTARDFVDTDVIIQTAQNRTLQDIVDKDGYARLREIEAETLFQLNVRNHIIATGGSAVYSEKSMTHLKTNAIVVQLDVDTQTLKSRVKDFSERGLAKPAHQSFEEMFMERSALYQKFADITVDCSRLTQEEVCQAILETLN